VEDGSVIISNSATTAPYKSRGCKNYPIPFLGLNILQDG